MIYLLAKEITGHPDLDLEPRHPPTYVYTHTYIHTSWQTDHSKALPYYVVDPDSVF